MTVDANTLTFARTSATTLAAGVTYWFRLYLT